VLFGQRNIDREVAALERRLQDRRDALRRQAAATSVELAKKLVSPSSLLLAFGAGFVLERVTGQEARGTRTSDEPSRPILGLLEWVSPLLDVGSLLASLARSVGDGAAPAARAPATAPAETPVPAAPATGTGQSS
jgi:hypothetical protein